MNQGTKEKGRRGKTTKWLQERAGTEKTETVFSGNDQINLSDFALFLSVMKVKEAYEDVISIILNEPNLKLKEVKAEQVILNKTGKRAIRLDAWALDEYDRQFDMEMQNDTDKDDIPKRSRFYQSMLDTPILKAGKKTRYKNLPSTVIIFITQDDIFGENLAMYTFTERCEEIPWLTLEDGTCKIFLNMTSKNGRPELVSLLQYMKYTTLENEDVTQKDDRILDLDKIVREVKQTEEWEVARMSILGIGLERGIEQGRLRMMARSVELNMKNFHVNLQEACEGLEISVEEYENAKRQIARWDEESAHRQLREDL